ncbi:MAG: glycosyltransferase family 4 protein [Candidatus Eremiobacter antarcticus]|nr:glycosyltransferase [Candidatus Eremiobacteraeota bacterium]PZR60847.1 MAG: glycosyltransferase family 4 protein [Candidatus Eremiobacter sp. RRmetagenome_bin22]
MARHHLTIGMFTDTYLPQTNGVVSSLLASADALRRRGHRVIIVAPGLGEVDEAHPDVFYLRSASFPFYPEFRMAFPLPAKLVANLPRVPFNVIHAHSFFFIGCLGAYLARVRNVPLAYTYHTRFVDYAHYLPVHQRVTKTQAVWISREFCNHCDRVITPTTDVERLLRSYGVEKAIDIIPTGIDLATFAGDGEVPRTIAALQGHPILLSVGRIAKEKNLDFLADAFAHLVTRRPDARLVMVGDGPYRSELEQRCVSLGCRELVSFVGDLPQQQLGGYYSNADCFVFSSKTETQGLVLLEAMAHGLPAVAVDCAVTREVLRSAAGTLTDDDPHAFADAVELFLREAPAQREARRQAARTAATPYSSDALAVVLEQLYVDAAGSFAVAR